jgi:hypothetical protein
LNQLRPIENLSLPEGTAVTASVRVVCLVLVVAASDAGFAAGKETVDLSPLLQPHKIAKVSVELEAGGNTLVRREGEGNDRAGADQRLPMSVSAKLQYMERRLVENQSTAPKARPLAIRYYNLAEAVIKVGQSGAEPRLPEDRRLIVVENGAARPSMYCPAGLLTREQLDLVDAIGNSYVVDELLPEKPVADGEAWPSGTAAMAALLTLDSVAVCEVQSVLEEFNASFAKVRLAGVVHGTADGAATEQEIRGVYLFDRRLRRITRLNLAVREKRSIGGATPGLDAVAKLQIKIEPVESISQLSDAAIAAALRTKQPAHELICEAPAMGFRFQHDRNWFVTSKQRENIMLRRIDGSDLAAQCTLTMLPPKSAGRQTTLEQFQKDIVYSLGKGFGELVSSRQWQNSHGHYCYEVVARGHVDEVPVEWHYYLVARDGGHRISATVTVEAPMVERMAGIDRQLIHSLELFPPLPAGPTANASGTTVK